MITGTVLLVAAFCGCVIIGQRVERGALTADRLDRRVAELAAESLRLGRAVADAILDLDEEYVKKCRVRCGQIERELTFIKHERRDLKFGVSVANQNTAGQW